MIYIRQGDDPFGAGEALQIDTRSSFSKSRKELAGRGKEEEEEEEEEEERKCIPETPRLRGISVCRPPTGRSRIDAAQTAVGSWCEWQRRDS